MGENATDSLAAAAFIAPDSLSADPLLLTEELVDPSQVKNTEVIDKVYTHTHADGKEFSGDIETITKLCPAMGKLALQDRIKVAEKSTTADRIAARARAKREAAELTNAQKQEPTEEKLVAEKSPAVAREIVEPVYIPEIPTETSQDQEITPVQPVKTDRELLDVRALQERQIAEQKLVETSEDVEAVAAVAPTIQTEIVTSTSEKPHMPQAKAEPTQTPKSETAAAPNIVLETELNTLETVEESTLLATESLIEPEETLLTELPEEAELVEDFYPEVSGNIAPIEVLVAIEEEAPEVSLFTDFLEEFPVAETPLVFVEIEAHAEEQPLEKTFAELAVFIKSQLPETDASETPTDEIIELPVLAQIKELTAEITAIFEEQSIENELAETMEKRLTPEIREKIYELLRIVGYSEPEQALEDMLSRYDIEFLIQTMRYLAQLTNPDNNQEFLTASNSDPLATLHDMGNWLGRAVLRLTTGSHQLPQAA